MVRGLGRESGDLDAIHIGEDAVELLQFGCNRYNGGRNALELRPTCQISRRGNREDSPEVSWESDLQKVTTNDVGRLRPWSCEVDVGVVVVGGCGRMDENEMDLGSLCVIDGMRIRRNQYSTGSRLFENTRYPTPDTRANWLR